MGHQGSACSNAGARERGSPSKAVAALNIKAVERRRYRAGSGYYSVLLAGASVRPDVCSPPTPARDARLIKNNWTRCDPTNPLCSEHRLNRGWRRLSGSRADGRRVSRALMPQVFLRALKRSLKPGDDCVDRVPQEDRRVRSARNTDDRIEAQGLERKATRSRSHRCAAGQHILVFTPNSGR